MEISASTVLSFILAILGIILIPKNRTIIANAKLFFSKLLFIGSFTPNMCPYKLELANTEYHIYYSYGIWKSLTYFRQIELYNKWISENQQGHRKEHVCAP